MSLIIQHIIFKVGQGKNCQLPKLLLEVYARNWQNWKSWKHADDAK